MAVMNHRQGGDPYEHVLGDLRKRRDELDIAIRAIEAVRVPMAGSAGSGASGTQDSLGSQNAGGEFSGVSIADASKKVLLRHDGPMNTADIIPIIQAGGVKLNSTDAANTVNSILSRRSSSVGDIVRVGRGRWDLKERASRAGLLIEQLEAIQDTFSGAKASAQEEDEGGA